MKIKLYIETQPWKDQLNIYMVLKDHNGHRQYAKPVRFEFASANSGLIAEPTFTFTDDLAREFLPALSNALAESGFRAETPDAAQLEATKFHLEDMRKLVFGGVKFVPENG